MMHYDTFDFETVFAISEKKTLCVWACLSFHHGSIMSLGKFLFSPRFSREYVTYCCALDSYFFLSIHEWM